MKTRSLLKLLGAICLAALIAIPLTVSCAAPAPAPEEEVINLTYAFYNPPSGLQGEGIMAWLDEIERHTNGKVQIEPYWGGALFTGKEMLKGVEDGAVDMGRINPAYYPTELPMQEMFVTIPNGPADFTRGLEEVISPLFQEFPEFEAELAKYNQKPLFRSRIISWCVCCTEPFTSFADFEGKRIRASSSVMLSWLEGAGAIPVSVPWGDCYMALSTGSIEGVFTNLDGIHLTKLDEAAPNIFTSRETAFALHYYDTINLDTWNNLPKDIQEQLVAASRAAEERYAELFKAEFDRCIAEQMEQGCEITFWTEEDLEKFFAMPIISELQEKWVEDAEAAGVDNAAQILRRTKELLAAVQ